MNTEIQELHSTVREGYQILLRADATLLLPTDCPKMCEFYQRLVQTCMNWAQEVHGELLRKEFLELESVKEKSRFRTQRYHFRMRVPWEGGGYAALLCESELTGQWKEPYNSYHRISHVWNTKEELILPFSQILMTFGVKLTKDMFPFRPDGIYPEGGNLVLFRNATETSVFLEKKLPRSNVSPDAE